MEFYREKDLFDYLASRSLTGVVALDGFDGSGKTTLARKLSDRFELPLLDLDSLLNGSKSLNYLEQIDKKQLLTFVSSSEKGLIVSGVCVRQVLNNVSITPTLNLYVKLVSSSGLWHQGWNIDSEYFDESEKFNGSLPLHSALTIEVLRYHREFRPHTTSDLYFVRTE